MANRDICNEQLNEHKKLAAGKEPVLTTGTGAPIGDKTNLQTMGPQGWALLQDFVYTDEMAHFDRERIPERVVHAKGAGAFGYFECTKDGLDKYTKLNVFSNSGKRTPLAIRFSTVGGESGSADTVRDPRGFSVKFYTEEGNWDLVGNNTPIFFIRDPIFFPSFIHTQKRNPQTHLKDPDMFWDFISLRPETTHQVMFLFSDRGIPDGYTHMNGYGSHTFELWNKEGKLTYVKFHFKTNQGIKNLTVEKAHDLSASDPDYSIRDLYRRIAQGNYPSWTLCLQLMTPEQAEKVSFNPFDVTKIWPQADFPLIPVGKMTLDRNPKNYFAEVEQLAFCPAHLVPGIQASPDKMLQGRLFSYSDTHRHRLGPNYLQIPVNCPFAHAKVKNYQRDGLMCTTDNQGGAPNYFPNSFGGPVDDIKHIDHGFNFKAPANSLPGRHESKDDDNFSQAGNFYRKVLNAEEKARLADNLAGHMKDAQSFIQARAIKNFASADKELGEAIQASLQKRGITAAL